MTIASKFPVIRDEFGTRPALERSTGEFGESEYRGSNPDTGDRVELSVTAGEYSGTEVSGFIGGKRLSVHIGTDEFGNEEITGTGAAAYKKLTRPRRDPWTDWM